MRSRGGGDCCCPAAAVASFLLPPSSFPRDENDDDDDDDSAEKSLRKKTEFWNWFLAFATRSQAAPVRVGSERHAGSCFTISDCSASAKAAQEARSPRAWHSLATAMNFVSVAIWILSEEHVSSSAATQ